MLAAIGAFISDDDAEANWMENWCEATRILLPSLPEEAVTVDLPEIVVLERVLALMKAILSSFSANGESCVEATRSAAGDYMAAVIVADEGYEGELGVTYVDDITCAC